MCLEIELFRSELVQVVERCKLQHLKHCSFQVVQPIFFFRPGAKELQLMQKGKHD